MDSGAGHHGAGESPWGAKSMERYTIDTNRSVALETAYGKMAKANGPNSNPRKPRAHRRATAAFTLIRGDQSNFLGQYRRNSHAMLAFRYSF